MDRMKVLPVPMGKVTIQGQYSRTSSNTMMDIDLSMYTVPSLPRREGKFDERGGIFIGLEASLGGVAMSPGGRVIGIEGVFDFAINIASSSSGLSLLALFSLA